MKRVNCYWRSSVPETWGKCAGLGVKISVKERRKTRTLSLSYMLETQTYIKYMSSQNPSPKASDRRLKTRGCNTTVNSPKFPRPIYLPPEELCLLVSKKLVQSQLSNLQS